MDEKSRSFKQINETLKNSDLKKEKGIIDRTIHPQRSYYR